LGENKARGKDLEWGVKGRSTIFWGGGDLEKGRVRMQRRGVKKKLGLLKGDGKSVF